MTSVKLKRNEIWEFFTKILIRFHHLNIKYLPFSLSLSFFSLTHTHTDTLTHIHEHSHTRTQINTHTNVSLPFFPAQKVTSHTFSSTQYNIAPGPQKCSLPWTKNRFCNYVLFSSFLYTRHKLSLIWFFQVCNFSIIIWQHATLEYIILMWNKCYQKTSNF